MRTTTPRPRSIAGAILALLAVIGALLGLAASAATADDGTAASADEKACVYTPPEDDGIHIRGCLRDQRTKPPTPVPDVTVTLTGPDDAVIDELQTDASGVFDFSLPGDPLGNLGKDFTITVDRDTIPEGSDLRNPDKTSVTINFNTTGVQTIIFPIDDPLPDPPSKLIQGLQLLVGGLVFAVLLAMAALGLSMIFGTTGLTNFAHGELITFGALVVYFVDQIPGDITVPGVGWNVTIIVGVLAAFVLGGAFGLLNDVALWRPLRRRGTGVIAAMIVSIGLSILLRNVYQYFAGGSNHNYSQYSDVRPWRIGQITFTPRDVAVVLVSVAVLLLVTSLLQFTKLGKATRAVADNPALASSTGINVQRVIGAVWTVGGALAGLSGALLGVTQGFNFQLGFKMLLLVFAAVVLGGLGTIWGAIVGALVIGAFVEVSTLFIPAELKYVGALVILILVMLVRPQGLLGRAQRIG